MNKEKNFFFEDSSNLKKKYTKLQKGSIEPIEPDPEIARILLIIKIIIFIIKIPIVLPIWLVHAFYAYFVFFVIIFFSLLRNFQIICCKLFKKLKILVKCR